MMTIICIVLSSGIVGAYLAKPTRDFGDTMVMVLNMLAVLVNVVVLAGKLNVPVA